ncbi:hypothetical protein [uncultured Methanofollis sp.]|uniref:hypothetical protein n=1 Tax=uncultured Methanofollis sp. TaxID=262500 RepID=UPI00261C4140|nr:hypothetical protein [uncultured Methanofollis sp.]
MRPIVSGIVCSLLISLFLVTAGCTGTEGPVEDGAKDGVAFNGTVTYVDLEGGFWGINGDDGGHFYPTHLPEEYQVEGLHVRVTAVPAEEGISIQMWGKRITVTGITRL